MPPFLATRPRPRPPQPQPTRARRPSFTLSSHTIDTRIREWIDGVGEVRGASEWVDHTPIWTGGTTWYEVMMGDLDGDPRIWYQKTTDEKSWSAPTVLEATNRGDPTSATLNGKWQVLYDDWTSGDTGGLIHIAAWDSLADELLWYSIDTSDDSISGPVVIASSITSGTSLAFTKARNGNLYLDNMIDNLYRSTDGGANWTALTTSGESGSDVGIFLPGNETDTADIWNVFHDQSASEISLKVWDNSLGTWSENVIATSMAKEINAAIHMKAISRHSDGRSVLYAWSGFDTGIADLMGWELENATTFNALTNVATNVDGAGQVSLTIDQNNDHLYCFLSPGSLATGWFGAEADVIYKRSIDGGTTWGPFTKVNHDFSWVSTGSVWSCPSISNIGAPKPTWVDLTKNTLLFAGKETDSVSAEGSFALNTIPALESFHFRARGSYQGNNSRINRPPGCKVGDLLLLITASGATGAAYGAPDGFTLLKGIGGGSTQPGYIAYKYVTAIEPRAYFLPGGATSFPTHNAILRISNVHALTGSHPFVVENYDVATAPDLPAVTTPFKNTLVLRGVMGDQGSWANPVEAGHAFGVVITNGRAGGGVMGFSTFPAAIPITLAADVDINSQQGMGFSIVIANPDPVGVPGGGMARKLVLAEIL